MPRRSLILRVFGALAFVALAAGQSDAAEEPGASAAPRGFVPMAASQPAVACKAAPTLRYYGGPVLQNVKVYSVNWGSNVSAMVTGQMPLFYADVVASPYLDWLSEYDTVGLNGLDGKPGSNQTISRGTFAGSLTIAPSLCAGAGSPGTCVVTDAQVQAELVAQIGAGHLPPPTTGCDGQLDTIYMVDFHSSVTIVGPGAAGSSCVNFCAYHGKGSYQGQAFAYAVLPDLSVGGCTAAGCGTNSVLQNTTAVASHELVESITDPLSPSPGRPLAWFDQTCGEIADICVNTYGTLDTSGTPWTVTQLWSNAAQSCITTKASLPPFCTAVNTPPGCRPCTCADGNACVVSAGDGGAPPDAGAADSGVVDAGAADTGVLEAGAADSGAADSGPAGDAATNADASALDATAEGDATVSLDASPGRDASANEDASPAGDDGGGGRPGESGGCGCALAETRSRESALAYAFLLALVVRRRARRALSPRG